MKILIIITGNWGLDISLKPNIEILKNYMLENTNNIVEYAGLSYTDDFHNYEDIIKFKYKEISNEKILTRLCYFINKYKDTFDYDWYIRFRPEVRLFESINFDTLCINSINARARLYNGPKKIKYGLAVNGNGRWSHVIASFYKDKEEDIVLDDIIIIFHNTLIKDCAFDFPNLYSDTSEHEWLHNTYYNYKKIKKNIIGINMMYINRENMFGYSGNINC